MNKNKQISESQVNLLDLLRYLLSYWKWYIVSMLFFLGYFTYDYYKTPYLYMRTATVMLRTADNTPETVRLQRNVTLVKNEGAAEIIQLQTREIIRSVISRIQADVSYTVKNGLRRKELYADMPIKISFLDLKESDMFSFQIYLKDQKTAMMMSKAIKGDSIMVVLGDTVSTPFGRLVALRNNQSLYQKDVVTVTKYDEESMINYYQSNLKVLHSQKEVPILKLVMMDVSASRASDFLYTLINIFNEKSIEDKGRVALNAGKFIEDRLTIIEEELSMVETNMESLQVKNSGIDVNTTASLYLTDSREYQSKRKSIKMRELLLSSLKQYLESAPDVIELIPNTAGLESVQLEQFITQYNKAVLQRNRLAEGNSVNNPVILELDQSLKEKKLALITLLESLYASLRLQDDENLEEEIMAKSNILAIPNKQREFLSVERQQKVKENLYIYLLNKREENALNGALTDSNMRIIDSPAGSLAPISPVKAKKMLMGGGCGLMLPTLILLLLYKFDTRVQTRSDVEGAVSLPFLGCVPFYKHKKSDSPILVASDRRDALSESFRIIRTNLSFLGSQSADKKVITCISFNPGAGKTFVSLNLSACLSLTNQKVIILDMDLRKATLSTQTNTRSLIGVSSYLSGQTADIRELIQHDIYGTGVDMIPSGPIAPNPSELLMNNRLDVLINELKKLYDYVVIDNVPVGVVADSSIVNRVTDISLFIVRAGKLDRRQLVELEQLYQDEKLHNMAVLLNGVTKSHKNGYGYGYGYGYN